MACKRSRRSNSCLLHFSACIAWGALVIGVCLLTGCAQIIQNDFTPSQLQGAFFGLTVNDYGGVNPLVQFGTTRSWDAYPGLDWADANPAPGQYNFAPLNAFIALNQARGAEIIYTFGRTPQWASTQPNAPGPYGPGQCGPPNLAAWDQYVAAVVTSAAGRIHYWELWNEPNYAEFYCGDIPTMVTLAQHAYGIIKSIDPAAKVLSPATSGSAGPAWLAAFLSGGGSSYVDIIAFHGYGTGVAENVNQIVSSFRTVMNADANPSMPMWDTEGSWGECTIGDDSDRAAFVAKYYVLQWSLGVARVVWYAYDNTDCWGRLEGTTPALNAAGTAYYETYQWIVGATLTKPCRADGNGTWVCSLTRPGGYQAEIVWNSTGNIASYGVPEAMAEYRDLTGKCNPITNGVVPVGNSPILIGSSAPPDWSNGLLMN
jgi:hypothetical protein